MASNELQIWYLLVDANGYAFKNSTVGKVSLPSNAIVCDIRNAVKAENAGGLLNGIDAPSLQVFVSLDALIAKSPIEISLPLAETALGHSIQEPLLVCVPTPPWGKIIVMRLDVADIFVANFIWRVHQGPPHCRTHRHRLRPTRPTILEILRI